MRNPQPATLMCRRHSVDAPVAFTSAAARGPGPQGEDVSQTSLLPRLQRTIGKKGCERYAFLLEQKRLKVQNVPITELSLMYAFKFEDMRYIDLSLCKSIGEEGYQYLADQNPRIETLIAKQCKLTDNCLLHIVNRS